MTENLIIIKENKGVNNSEVPTNQQQQEVEKNKKCGFCHFWPAQKQWEAQIVWKQVNYCSYRCKRADLCLANEEQKEQWRKSARNSWKEYEEQEENHKIIRKKCLGCLATFTCYKSKNYDYCSACELNNSRYLNKDSPCSECDGSGLIKFKNQPPRNCKLCYLTNQEKQEEKPFIK